MMKLSLTTDPFSPEVFEKLVKTRLTTYLKKFNVIISAENPQDLSQKGSLTMINMQTWCVENGIQLNIGKSNTIQFGPKNKIMDYSILIKTEEKFLENLSQ